MRNLDHYEKSSREQIAQFDRYRAGERIQAAMNAGDVFTRGFVSANDPHRTRRCWCGRPADHAFRFGEHVAWGPKGPPS